MRIKERTTANVVALIDVSQVGSGHRTELDLMERALIISVFFSFGVLIYE